MFGCWNLEEFIWVHHFSEQGWKIRMFRKEHRASYYNLYSAAALKVLNFNIKSFACCLCLTKTPVLWNMPMAPLLPKFLLQKPSTSPNKLSKDRLLFTSPSPLWRVNETEQQRLFTGATDYLYSGGTAWSPLKQLIKLRSRVLRWRKKNAVHYWFSKKSQFEIEMRDSPLHVKSPPFCS